MPRPATIRSLFAILATVALVGACATIGGDRSDTAPAEADHEKSPAIGLAFEGAVAAATQAVPPPPVDLGPALDQARHDIDEALTLAMAHAPARRSLPEEPLSYREILNGDRAVDGTLSLGTIRSGSLRGARALPLVGNHHEIIERHRRRHTNFGTDELIEAIKGAAAKVDEVHGGAPLRVGNLSRRRGGNIPWSSSHEAGRDADLAFYVVDKNGESVPSPDLIGFDEQGRALDEDLYFDVPRNWTFVEALLTDPSINLHWLFVSEGLKTLLLQYALDNDVPPELFARAAKILHQPTDAPPHDDHLHLRIGCSTADRLEGCVDWGPQWDWYDWHDAELFARTHEIRRAFDDPSPEIRQEALRFLHRIRAPYGPEIALVYGLGDDDEEVRQAAQSLLSDLPLRSVGGVQVLRLHLENGLADSGNMELLYSTLRRAQPEAAVHVALARYFDDELSTDERALAIAAMDHRLDTGLIPTLIDALEAEESPTLRPLLARQLRRISARTDGVDWSQETLNEVHQKALAQWRQWWEETGPDRTIMLAKLLESQGVEEWKDLEAVDRLIPLLRTADDHKRYNINLVLSDWTGRWVPHEWENERDAYRFWTRWWDRNRERVLDDTPRIWEQ